MKIKFSLLILTALLIVPISAIQDDNIKPSQGLDLSQSNLPYVLNGTITEDADEVWDPDEFDIINYKIAAGENLTIEFFTSANAELHVFYGNFSDYQDIEEALRDMADYDESDRLLAGNYTVDGYLSFTYNPSTDVDNNIAIFTLDPTNPPSMNYSIYSSIEGIIVQPSTPTDSGFDMGLILTGLTYLIPVVFIGLLIFSLYKRRGSRQEEKVKL